MTAAPSAGARRQLDALARSQPEAGPWLALVETTLHEAENPAWDSSAEASRLLADQPTPAPLLTGAEVPLDRAAADAWVRRLLALAGEAGPEAAPLRDAARSPALDPLPLLEAAINQGGDELSALAGSLAVEPGALGALAQLAATPLLQALRHRLAGAVDPRWDHGACPICGAWPALAESRGLERARRLRCGRCGADWGAPSLRCAFCGTTDHARLGTLAPEANAEARKAETCDVCRGYLKQVATLRPWAGDEVALADLGTIDLDLAALERDYARPDAPPFALGLRLSAASPGEPGR